MKKLKLLLAFCALLLGVGNANAQTDVTSTYLTNADFSSTTGWTANQSSEYYAIGNGLIGTYKVNNGTAATVDANHPADAYCFGFQSRWNGNFSYYTQETETLPAGYYRLTFDVQNTNSSTSSHVYDNFCYVTVGSDKFIDSEYRNRKTEWMAGNTEWTTHTINFSVSEASSATIALGYGQAANNYGNTATPYIYISNLKLEQLPSKPSVIAIDKTSLITNNDMTSNINGWTSTTNAQNKARADNQTGDFRGGFYENWNGNAYTGKMYQTVSGLPNGIYELSMCAFVETLGEAGTQYIYAGSNKTNITTGNPTQYSVTDIEVTDGTLEIGFEQTVATSRWCGIDYATLVKIGDLDLSAFIAAYNTALTNAKTVAATEEKISATVLAALNTVIDTYDTGKVNEEDQDALVTAKVALDNATAAANTSIASYAVIAAGSVPDNSLDGWVCENTNTFHINTWSSEGNSDGSNMKTPFIENWVANGSYLGAGKVYYQLSGLEPGEVYYAQALVRSYNEASSDAPNGPNFFVNDETVDMTKEGTTFTYDNKSGIYATLGVQATIGADGILKLGVEIADNRNYNWVAFKSVKIQELSAAYNEAVANAEALEGKISATAYSALETAISAYSEVTIENISSINSLVATYSALVNPYAAFNALKEKANTLKDVANDNATANGTLVTAISDQTTAVEAATTAEAINTATSTLKSAMVTYVGVATPEGDGAKFDCTFMLTNPDLSGFPAWQKPIDGWYTDQTFGDQNFQTMNEDTKMFMEYWSGANNATSGYVLYQQLTLEPGTYKMEAECKAGWGAQATDPSGMQAITFSAGETDGTSITSTTLADASIEFVQSASGVVKIGLKAHTGNTCNWMGIGYVELYKVPAKVYEISENAAWDYSQSGAGDVTLTRTIAANYNTVVFPFSMTQAEVEDKFGEGSKVYVISAFANDNITFAVQEGIQANKPCLLKATEAGTSYTLEGRTIVSAANAAPSFGVDGISMVGNYNASATVPADANNYIVSGDALYLVNSAVTVKNTRAYFNVETENPARSIRMSFDGITGIATVENGAVKSVETGDIYDISGRKVKKPSKGIYLMNGKKFAF